MQNRWDSFSMMKLGLICLSIVLLNGCASWFVPGMGELKRLCELDGGDKIYKVVHTDGYYDANSGCGKPCLYSLIHSDYKYIEYKEVEAGYHSAMSEPGYFRIYKSNTNDPLCSSRLKNMFSKSQGKSIRDFFLSRCLAAKKLDKPESQYWYRNGIDVKYLDSNEEVEFITAYKSIEDMDNKEVIARTKHYRLVPYKKSALSYSASYDCAAAGVDFKSVRFPESILLPNK